jgi:hypothetical protein
MKKVFLAFVALLIVAGAVSLIPLHAQIPKVDPIETTVSADGVITITHVFTDGHTQVLVATRSLSQANAVWLDAVNTLGK